MWHFVICGVMHYVVRFALCGVINPQRACAARVTVVVLSVCMCVCVCVHSYLLPHTLEPQKRDTNGFCAIQGSFKKRDFSLKRFVPKLWRRLLTLSSSGVVSGILVPFFRRN